MGVVSELEVAIRAWSDGCLIMEGTYESPFLNLDYCERYAAGTPFCRLLWALASWVSAVEGGERGSEELWLQLQLPFDQ